MLVRVSGRLVRVSQLAPQRRVRVWKPEPADRRVWVCEPADIGGAGKDEDKMSIHKFCKNLTVNDLMSRISK